MKILILKPLKAITFISSCKTVHTLKLKSKALQTLTKDLSLNCLY